VVTSVLGVSVCLLYEFLQLFSENCHLSTWGAQPRLRNPETSKYISRVGWQKNKKKTGKLGTNFSIDWQKVFNMLSFY